MVIMTDNLLSWNVFYFLVNYLIGQHCLGSPSYSSRTVSSQPWGDGKLPFNRVQWLNRGSSEISILVIISKKTNLF